MPGHRASTSTTMDLVSLDSGSNSTTRMSDGGKVEEAARGDSSQRSNTGDDAQRHFETGEADAMRPLEGWRLGGVTTA